jgi:hypothetical protein
MSARGLQTLLVSTLTDRGRKDALLHGSVAAFDGFDLSAGEIADLLSIRAETLEDFALHAHALFYGENLLLDEEPLDIRRAGALPERASA